MPPSSRRALRLAACIGNGFDLDSLAVICTQSVAETATAISAAVKEGLVVPVADAYRLVDVRDGSGAFADAEFRFIHDRVQQAAYSLIGEDERKAVHLQIGRLLLRGTRKEELSERLFDIVDHVNRGSDLIASPQEKLELLDLNLEAGKRATRMAAYEQGLSYFAAAVALLPSEAWSTNYSRALELFTAAAEAAFMTGKYDRVESSATQVLKNAHSALDKVPAQLSRLKAANAQDKLMEALVIGQEALAPLGVRLPRDPQMRHVIAAAVKTKLALRGRKPEALAEHRVMSDPAKIAAMFILERMAPSAFRSGSKLFPVIILRLVDLSLKHGNMAVSSFGYAGYALMLCGILGDIDLGYRFGKMAMTVADRSRDDRYRASSLCTFDMFIRHWRQPLSDSLEPLMESFKLSSETGRVFEAVWAVCYRAIWAYASGREIPYVEQQIDQLREVFKGDDGARRMADLLRQVLANLSGATSDPWRLQGEHYDETAMQAGDNRVSDKTEVAYYHAYKLQLCYLFGDTAGSLGHAVEGEKCLEALTSMPMDPLLRFYAALSRLAALRNDPSRRTLLRSINKTRTLFRKWARFAPANYAHKHLLLEAEHARTVGRAEIAGQLYEQSVREARKNGFIQEEALALELAGDFHLQGGHAIAARAFLDEALLAYRHWGAHAKVQHLAHSHPLPPAARARPRAERRQGGGGFSADAGRAAALDLASLMKAAGAISAEMKLDRLLASLIKIVVENAGAERGALVLAKDDGRLLVQAENELASGTVRVLADTPLGEAPLCEAIVHYVVHTGEHEVIEDALEHQRWRSNRYVRQENVRSILCVPIKQHGGGGGGALYLENRATAGAFTPDRVDTVALLAAQAAISLQNASLYGSLDSALRTQVALTEAQRRFVPKEFLKSLGRSSIADVRLGDSVEKEMSILFSDIRGFTSLVEGMPPERNIHFINEYLRFMETPIEENRGFVDSYIGDGIMALFEHGADSALNAALAMLRALTELNKQRVRDGHPEIRVGIGINTGRLTLGTIGGEKRLKCGVIGDSVNLAARVEQLTKFYGSSLLITGCTYARLREPSLYDLRVVGRVQVVGRNDAVVLYEVFTADAPAQLQAKRDIADLYAQALDFYFQRRFESALPLLQACQSRVGEDFVVARFLHQCGQYRMTPPSESWLGVESVSAK